MSAVALGVRDGRPVIISGSSEQTVRVWDLESEPNATLQIGLHHRVLLIASAADRDSEVVDLAHGDRDRSFLHESGVGRGIPAVEAGWNLVFGVRCAPPADEPGFV